MCNKIERGEMLNEGVALCMDKPTLTTVLWMGHTQSGVGWDLRCGGSRLPSTRIFKVHMADMKFSG